MLQPHISIPLTIVSTTHLCTLVLKQNLHKASREQTPPPLPTATIPPTPPPPPIERSIACGDPPPAWRGDSGDKVCG